MTHGRDHDERQQKAPRSRANNTPGREDEDVGIEAELAVSGRSSVRPHMGLIGAGVEGQGPAAGSEVAPTHQAERRERLRHRLEREMGRTAAGTDGRERDVRVGEVTREGLQAAAREADRAMTDRHPSETRTRFEGGR